MYQITNQTRSGRFVKRSNRFAALVEVDGQLVKAHVPNSGRMKELLYPGNRVVLEEQSKEGRKTPYDLIIAQYGDLLVSIDSRLPNYLVSEAINQGLLTDLVDYQVERREVVYGDSRLDIKLTGKREGFCEVKSVTLVKNGVAMFPDAPTSRGVRHLRELIRAYREGYDTFVIFLIQRDDAVIFTPNRETDPEFANTLKEAVESGVQAKAYICKVDSDSVRISGQIPVELV